MSIWAGTRGHLDGVDVSDVGRFEGELLDWFRTRHADVLAGISESGKIADEDAFDASIAAFAEQFEGSVAGGSTPDAESTDTASTLVDADTTLPEEDISGDRVNLATGPQASRRFVPLSGHTSRP